MSDIELRRRERDRVGTGMEATQALVRARIRSGSMERERLRVAAFLGDPTARDLLGEVGRAPLPSAVKHAVGRRLHAAWQGVASFGAGGLRAPYTGDLRDWILGLSPLGLPACAELCRILLELVAHQRGALARCLKLAREAVAGGGQQAYECAAEAARISSWVIPPDELRRTLHEGLVAWGLGERLPPPLRERSYQFELWESSDPMLHLFDRMICDAYSQGASLIRIDGVGPVASVRYTHADREESWLTMPGRTARELISTCVLFSGLKPCSETSQGGSFAFERWSRFGLRIQIDVQLGAGQGLPCELRFVFA